MHHHPRQHASGKRSRTRAHCSGQLQQERFLINTGHRLRTGCCRPSSRRLAGSPQGKLTAPLLCVACSFLAGLRGQDRQRQRVTCRRHACPYGTPSACAPGSDWASATPTWQRQAVHISMHLKEWIVWDSTNPMAVTGRNTSHDYDHEPPQHYNTVKGLT
jgi:hypothetical protein